MNQSQQQKPQETFSAQIWACIRGGAERVYGAGAVGITKKPTAMIWCAEHGRLCSHKYIRNEERPYIEFRQGTNVVDTRN